MQMIIDIDDKLYETIKVDKYEVHKGRIFDIIRNGTPLPKGHWVGIDEEPKTRYCKDCKWWKDSDGVYRRGIGAESKCLINTKVVRDGLGYCYKFKPKAESEE